MTKEHFFVGSYTQVEGHVPNGHGDGIYAYTLDTVNGNLTGGSIVAKNDSDNDDDDDDDDTLLSLTNPTYLHFDQAKRRLYAIEETVDADRPACLISYIVDQKDHDDNNKNDDNNDDDAAAATSSSLTLTEQSRVETPLQAGCHLCQADDGDKILVAAYVSGDILCQFVDKDDGSLMPYTYSTYSYSGTGPNKDRQEAPHAHQVAVRGNSVYVCDLGTDTIWCHDIAQMQMTVTSTTTSSSIAGPRVAAKCPPGSGPRHLVFHPTLPMAFVICELSGMLLSYRINDGDGDEDDTRTFDLISQVSSLPEDFEGTPCSAAIRMHPTGEALYVSNRGGHNSIAVFPIKKNEPTNDDNGATTPTTTAVLGDPSWFTCGGITPRDFALDSSGQWLIVANQDDDTLAVFRLVVTSENHQIIIHQDSKQIYSCKSPACIAFSTSS